MQQYMNISLTLRILEPFSMSVNLTPDRTKFTISSQGLKSHLVLKLTKLIENGSFQELSSQSFFIKQFEPLTDV